jgi:hypothetical protein
MMSWHWSRAIRGDFCEQYVTRIASSKQSGVRIIGACVLEGV